MEILRDNPRSRQRKREEKERKGQLTADGDNMLLISASHRDQLVSSGSSEDDSCGREDGVVNDFDLNDR